MPKNNKSAPIRIILFLLLTCVLLWQGQKARVPMLDEGGLSRFVKEVIPWMETVP